MAPAWPCWKRNMLKFKTNPLKEKKKYKYLIKLMNILNQFN